MKAFAAFLVAMAAGCHTPDERDVEVSDEIGPVGQVPYALGSKIEVNIHNGFKATSDPPPYSIVSDDPSVFSVAGVDGSYRAAGQATGTGTTMLTVYYHGSEKIARLAVEVVRADRAGFTAAGMARARIPQPPLTELRVVGGGTAVYAVEYWSGARAVLGRGILKPTVTAPNKAARTDDYLVDGTGEWLTVTAAPGTSEVALAAAGTALGTVPLVGVDAAEIQAVSVVTNEDAVSEGSTAYAVAQARDGDGHAVGGARFDWTLSGGPSAIHGDVFNYDVYRDQTTRLHVAVGAHVADVVIHSTADGRGPGACQIGSSRSASGGGWLLLVFLLLAARRRRASFSSSRGRSLGTDRNSSCKTGAVPGRLRWRRRDERGHWQGGRCAWAHGSSRKRALRADGGRRRRRARRRARDEGQAGSPAGGSRTS
jgi:MYXO-CTERM domain-containing protein